MSLVLAENRNFIQAMNLPSKVKLVEVGPRDGLQNQAVTITVKNRVAFIDWLSASGFTAIESGSLVSPKYIPQMADSEIVYQQIQQQMGTEYILLVPNQKGFDRAIACRAKHIAVLCAASDAFSLNNINCSVNQSMETIQSICRQAQANNIAIRAYISCVLGCPYQGDVDLNRICQLAAKLYEYGCYEISLGDTIGVGTPGKVMELLAVVKQAVPVDSIAVHFHDTYGQALANILTALQSGIQIIDCSVGGLGGCPFAPGASGNVATEDVVYMLNGLGVKTGIDLEKLFSASWFIADILQRQPTAKVPLAIAAKAKNNCH